MRGLLRDCLVEMVDRKILYVFLVLTVIGAISVFGAYAMDLEIQGQQLDIEEINQTLGNPVLRIFNWIMSYVLILVAVFTTAGLIPGMFVRGRADYFISKPISRSSLILSKLFSIWIVYGITAAVSLLINYALAGVLFGSFDSGILTIVGVNLLVFLIWLSVTGFVGVVSGSTGMAVMAAFLVWLAQFLLSFHEAFKQFVGSRAIQIIVDTLYYIFPKPGQIQDNVNVAVMGGSADWMPLGTSLAFALILILITVAVFRRKGY